jgi:hypothetical protein
MDTGRVDRETARHGDVENKEPGMLPDG